MPLGTVQLPRDVDHGAVRAEASTGWSRVTASGRPVLDVFRIIDGETRAPARGLMCLAVERDKQSALAPNCLLIQREGREVAIEGSSAPLRDGDSLVIGAVIVVRDAGAARDRSQRPDDGLTADDLVACADAAKRAGHGTCRLFQTRMSFASAEHANRAGHEMLGT